MAGTTNSAYRLSRFRVPLATAGLLFACLFSSGRAAGFLPRPFRDYADATWSPVTATAERSVNGPQSARPPSEAPAPTPRPTPAPKPSRTPRPTDPPPAPQPAPQPASPSVAQAQAWALAELGAYEYGCLASIVHHEDGTWDPYRTNSTSGAYGIPQALPGSKMAWAGADWRTNRITQVRWMIHYVTGRYRSACGGWAFWQAHRWY